MPSIPRTFRVLGQKYTVKPYAHIVSSDGEGQLCGDIDHQELLMRISTTLAPDMQAETFMHEVLHAVLTKAHYGASTKQFAPGEHEEFVDRVAPILLDFLRANPRAVTFLTGRDS